MSSHFSNSRAHGALGASIAFALTIGGCMASPGNGSKLPAHNSPITLNGLTGQPNSKVEIMAQDYCSNTLVKVTAPGVADPQMSSSTPMVFKNVTSTGDMSGFPWSVTYPSVTGADCRFWSPYGCSFPDWGPNQSTLRLRAHITDPSGNLGTAMTFGDAAGEANVLNCVKTKQRDALLAGQPPLSQVDAALLCKDSDFTADIQTRNFSATWALDFTGMTIEKKDETGVWPILDGDEPYNPVIMGFRGLLKSSANLNVQWIGSLNSRDLEQGQVYTLDDRQGRIQFRNVDIVDVAEWLGCDPATARVKPAEIMEALDLSNKEAPTAADLVRGLALFNSFRCDLNQTPKDITVLGYALQALEEDGTQNSLTVGAVNSARDTKRNEYQVQLRNVGAQLQAVRTAYRGAIQFCNDTRRPDGSFTGECLTRFKNVDPETPTAQSLQISAGVFQALGSVGLDIVGWIIAGGDNDDEIGETQVAMYLAIEPEFMSLLTRFAADVGVALPPEMSLLAHSQLKVTSENSSAKYVTRGQLYDYTRALRGSLQAAERARNAGRCPWTAPAESVNTGVNM